MKSNAIIVIVAVIILSGGAYFYFFTGNGDQPPLTETGVSTNDAQAQFQTLLGELSPISFDPSIFSDARFNALVDLSTPVSPETTGRLDPFSAMAVSSSQASSVSAATTTASSTAKVIKTK